MTPPDISATIHHQLGALDAKVELLLKQQEKAGESRKEQYEKQEAMERRMDGVDAKLTTIDGRLDKMEPVTADIGKWKERFIGMRILIVFTSAVFGGLVVTFGKWLAVKLGLM